MTETVRNPLGTTHASAHGPTSASTELYARARRVIPGGVHLSGRALNDPTQAPLYFERGKGCRVWDVDGREYIDFIMAYGPPLLGYANERVDLAVREQATRGNLLSLNHPLQVALAERLASRIPHADMVVLLKTGSEATTAALRIARRCTGRRRAVRCGYHGWHDWCLPLEPYVPGGLERQVLEFDANDPKTLSSSFDEYPAEIAAVIVAPEMVADPRRELFEEMMEIAHRHGALFVLDEVKTGLRIAPGSFQEHLGFTADLTTLSKALGNGWPVAAVVGRREIMEYGAGMHLSATYHAEASAMAGALATLDVIDEEDVQGHVWRLGRRLIDGLNEAAGRHGIPARAFGEPLPPMPFLRFAARNAAANDVLSRTFFGSVLQQGILLHPRHLWFISHAHQAADIDRAIAVADVAFEHTAEVHAGLLSQARK
jgi:glutamate-1-semialdehyde 2,1-aminomutase